MAPGHSDLIRGRTGFTLLELMIVVTVASILIGIAVPRLTGAMHQRDVNGVRDGVILLATRARVQAMETARIVEFRLDTDRGIASVIEPVSGDTVEAMRFADEMSVNAESSPSSITLCYTPRGFATEPCSTSLSVPRRVVFERANHEATLEIWQLGQVRKL